MPSRAVLKEDDTIPHMPAGAFVMEEEVPLMPPGAFVKEEVVVKREHEVVADEGGRSEGRPKRRHVKISLQRPPRAVYCTAPLVECRDSCYPCYPCY
jgi:hypothetical protein